MISNTTTEPSVKAPQKIAVFANGWSCEFLSLTIEAIRKEAAKDNADVFLFVDYNLPTGIGSKTNHQKQLFHLFDPKEYDGVIVLANTLNTKEEHEILESLLPPAKLPMVSTEVSFPGAAFVGTDNYRGVYELAEHLIEKHNVKNIVFVSGFEGHEENAIRRKALEDVLEKHGMTLQDTILGNFDFYHTTIAGGKWFDDGNPLPDAFVCANDLMALAMVEVLHRQGLSVPEDALVTGFDRIRDGLYSVPLLATVSRRWDVLGTEVYNELRHQFIHRNPLSHQVLDSAFIPSESCGCEADPEAKTYRMEKMRNLHTEINQNNMVDFFFQEIRVEMARVENKEQFYEIAKQTLGKREFFGKDYCICTDSTFFNDEDEEKLRKSDRFSDDLLVLYERRDGESAPQRRFPTQEIYPGYVKEAGESNLYVISPMYGNNMAIGYIVMKNKPDVLYDIRFRRWINDLEALMITIRQYIFSQRANRELRTIYMSDYLSEMYNRTGCENVLFPFLEKEHADGRSCLLVFADINRMKEINDDYGHLNGDLAIKAVASALKEALPKDWILARYGGDEFIAAGPLRDGESIERFRNHFNTALDQLVTRNKLPFPLTASFGGVEITPETPGGIDDFLSLADESMYIEKEKAHRN